MILVGQKRYFADVLLNPGGHWFSTHQTISFFHLESKFCVVFLLKISSLFVTFVFAEKGRTNPGQFLRHIREEIIPTYKLSKLPCNRNNREQLGADR